MSIFKTAVLSIVLAWLPIQDLNTKMQIGLILSEITSDKYILWLKNKFTLCRKKQITIPEQTRDRDSNPLFEKVQEYLAIKYSKQMESCELIPKNGDIDFSIKDMTGKKFIDTFIENNIEHLLEIQIEEIQESGKNNRGHFRQIVISSKTASPENIKNYTKKISTVQLKNSSIIKVFRPIIQGKKKEDRTVEWEGIMVKSNKTLQNTIYSEEIKLQLFDDIDIFMNSEDSYARKGIPYKRGYFLYSTPGQGKTSVAKIIANKYNTPVFCLDLTTIDDNPTLIKLMTELNYYTNQEKYILLIEDAERAAFFNHSRYKEPNLSMDCFLNVLDGVVEPHGRIILMSANDPDSILSNTALMRPGRIDKILELKSCDKYQIKKMFELFYPEAAENVVNWDNWELKENLSAAYIMKLLQENTDNSCKFMELIGQAKTGDDADIQVDETFKKAIETAKSTKQEKKHHGSKYRKKFSLEDSIRNTKKNLTRSTKLTKIYERNMQKSTAKLACLLEKLKVTKEQEKIKKLKEKATKRNEYILRKNQEGKINEIIEEYDEEEYETPVFMLNSIDKESIDPDVITTYENYTEE